MGKKIAIDGPAGAGKSTIAKLVAKEMNYIYVDTGAMFRGMALYYLENQIAPDDQNTIEKLCDKIDVSLRYENGNQKLYLNQKDVSTAIRNEEVGNMASAISVYGKVREKLLFLQRKIAAENDVVMDGRDIGTAVLPDAEVKIYLTASTKTRAKRRYQELTEKKISCNLQEIENDFEERDYRDMHRKNAPLKQAEDAILVDSSEMSIEEVVQKILSFCR